MTLGRRKCRKMEITRLEFPCLLAAAAEESQHIKKAFSSLSSTPKTLRHSSLGAGRSFVFLSKRKRGIMLSATLLSSASAGEKKRPSLCPSIAVSLSASDVPLPHVLADRRSRLQDSRGPRGGYRSDPRSEKSTFVYVMQCQDKISGSGKNKRERKQRRGKIEAEKKQKKKQRKNTRRCHEPSM